MCNLQDVPVCLMSHTPWMNYGSVLAIVWWGAGYKELIYSATNLALAEEVCQGNVKRSRIETFFSDQRSQGFNLHKSHISNPMRLARLMLTDRLT